MKVLVIADLYPRPENPARGIFVHRQVEAVSETGCEVRVICPIAQDALPIPREQSQLAETLKSPFISSIENIPVIYLPYPHVPLAISPRLESYFLKRALLKKLRPFKAHWEFDILHGHRLFPIGHAVTEVADQLDVPVVVTARGSDVNVHPKKSTRIATLTRRTIDRSNGVVAVSEALARNIRDMAGKELLNLEVVYNGVDLDMFSPRTGNPAQLRRQLGLPIDGIGLITVCRLVKEKGIRELITAFEAVSDLDDLWLAVVGDGPQGDWLRKRIAQPNMSARVYHQERIPQVELSKWYRAADIFALPSYAEGVPNVLYEAMASALPVIATRVGGIPEVTEEGRTAVLVPPRQVAPLTTALRRLVDDARLRRRMGAAGRKLVEEKYTWERSAARIINTYDRLHQESSSSGNRDASSTRF